VPTGRPRGRPKANAAPAAEKQVAEDNGDDQDDDNSVEEVQTSPEKTAVAPKKRGRPAVTPSKSAKEGTPKPRGRPTKATNDDEDDADSTEGEHNNSKKESNEEGRRPDGTPTKGDGLKWSSDGDNDGNEEYVSDVYNDAESVAA